MSTTSTNTLERLLLAFFKEMASSKEQSNFEKDKDAFVFHMTDWQSNLSDLAELFSHPESIDEERAERVLQDLFFHVLPHLNVAAEIYDDAPEIYKMHNREKPQSN